MTIPNLPKDLPMATEGFTTIEQQEHIHSLITQYIPTAKYILEIGFNAGHSSHSFLKFLPESIVVSFDIGTHPYVKRAKELIDQVYPERHTLILGDSVVTVPSFDNRQKFDVIFIDGGHQYSVVKADIENSKRFAHPQTLLLVDDTVRKPKWNKNPNKGPTQAWMEAVQSGQVVELGSQDYGWARGMSWGRYN